MNFQGSLIKLKHYERNKKMAEDKNNDMNLAGVLRDIKLNDVKPNMSTNSNSNVVDSRESTKTKIVPIRIPKDESDRLQQHLKERGYDAFSTGLKYIIRKYMKDNNI